ncbi:MAG: hypothetical protein ABR912_04175 [Terracidiphilus sp.]
MTFKFGSQYRGAILWLICLALVRIAFAQCPTHQEEAKQALTVITLGNLITAHGHNLPFRVYSASDGTTGKLIMAEFDSLEAAQQQIDEWIKGANEIACREQHQNGGDQKISDRILAQAISKTDSKTKIFLIIRRDGLDCYLIESSSMQVALQIEGLISYTQSTPAR